MGESKLVWLASFLVTLHRGNIVEDSASLADRAVVEYNDRFEDFDEPEETA